MKKILITLVTIVFLALSACGNNEEIIKNIIKETQIGYQGTDNFQNVTNDLILPTSSSINKMAVLVWESTNLEVLKHDGKVIRPTDADIPVTLKLHVTIDKIKLSDERNIIIKKWIPSGELANPRITGPSNKSVVLGETIDLLLDFRALDCNNKDITSSIVVDDSLVNYEQIGIYRVTYSVTDEFGLSASITINLSITSNLHKSSIYEITDENINETIKVEGIVIGSIATNVLVIQDVTAGIFIKINEDIAIGTQIEIEGIVSLLDVTNFYIITVETYRVKEINIEIIKKEIDASLSASSNVFLASITEHPIIGLNETPLGHILELDVSRFYGIESLEVIINDISNPLDIELNDNISISSCIAAIESTKIILYPVSTNDIEIIKNDNGEVFDLPEIRGYKDQYIYQGEHENEAYFLDGLKAVDCTGKNITDYIVADISKIDFDTIGIYDCVLSVTDDIGGETSVVIKVHVIERDSYDVTNILEFKEALLGIPGVEINLLFDESYVELTEILEISKPTKIINKNNYLLFNGIININSDDVLLEGFDIYNVKTPLNISNSSNVIINEMNLDSNSNVIANIINSQVTLGISTSNKAININEASIVNVTQYESTHEDLEVVFIVDNATLNSDLDFINYLEDGKRIYVKAIGTEEDELLAILDNLNLEKYEKSHFRDFNLPLVTPLGGAVEWLVSDGNEYASYNNGVVSITRSTADEVVILQYTIFYKELSYTDELIIGIYSDSINMIALEYVTFGGSIVADEELLSGSSPTKASDPSKDGYKFGGWYQDSNYSSSFDFDAPLTSSKIIYAKWIKEITISFETKEYNSYLSSINAYQGDSVLLPFPWGISLNGNYFLNWEYQGKSYSFNSSYTFDDSAVLIPVFGALKRIHGYQFEHQSSNAGYDEPQLYNQEDAITGKIVRLNSKNAIINNSPNGSGKCVVLNPGKNSLREAYVEFVFNEGIRVAELNVLHFNSVETNKLTSFKVQYERDGEWIDLINLLAYLSVGHVKSNVAFVSNKLRVYATTTAGIDTRVCFDSIYFG